MKRVLLITSSLLLISACSIPFTQRNRNTKNTTDTVRYGLEERVMVTGLNLPAVSTQRFPSKLSETGIFQNIQSLTPRPGIIEYSVKFPHWSDGASHLNWIALRNTDKVVFSANDPWTFPVETVLIKHFQLPRGPNQVWRVETRLLVRYATGWFGVTYQWDPDQLDATLLDNSTTQMYAVYDSANPTVPRQQTWTYPSPAQCITCHGNTGALGVRTGQLNHAFNYSTIRDNQLRAWNHVAIFDRDIGSELGYSSYPAQGDATVNVGIRARTYLQVNCAHCHQPLAGVDLRLATDLTSTGLVNVTANNPLGITDLVRIKPGDETASALWLRMNRTPAEGNRMPPIATSENDTEGILLIRNWIRGLQ